MITSHLCVVVVVVVVRYPHDLSSYRVVIDEHGTEHGYEHIKSKSSVTGGVCVREGYMKLLSVGASIPFNHFFHIVSIHIFMYICTLL